MSEYRSLLRVSAYYAGGGIREISEPKCRHDGRNVPYASLGMPAGLVERFDYWISWYNSYESWNGGAEFDDELFHAYALSLAIDLKRFLGDDYYIEYRNREIHDDREYLRAAKH